MIVVKLHVFANINADEMCHL